MVERIGARPRRGRQRRGRRRGRRRLPRTFMVAFLVAILATTAGVTQVACGALVALSAQSRGPASPAARGTGNDAEWLGHAWVDGRKGQSDVEDLAARVRSTGIRDLFVHAGPFRDDGSLDPALRPRARWLTAAVHAALPGVRVQAWLGAHPVPDQLHLEDGSTRARILDGVASVLRDGFDGVHFDFEPVPDGDPDLLAMLRATRPVMRERDAVLSVSATRVEPWSGVATGLEALTPATMWSRAYLRQVALLVDQVAVLSYDSALPTAAAYTGYVRRATLTALAAVPDHVALLIGLPAYADASLVRHPTAETMAAGLRGVRLALGADPPHRTFGVAVYVDFTATPQDWESYRTDWLTGW